ncbi:PIF1-like helicase-domain-containing protein, partial [Lentinula raphanica]
MPLPSQNWAAQSGNDLIAEQSNYHPYSEREKANSNLILMNQEQRTAFDTVMRSIEDNNGGLFFLSGPGGTGKTFVYCTLCHAIRARRWIVLCVASS